MSDKAVVLGGSGFLGSHLADELSRKGFETVVFDRVPSPWISGGQTMVVGDILDPEALSEAARGARYVYHLAGIADIGQAASRPRTTITTNIIGSVNVIEACLKAEVERLMFASTVYVYSNQGSFYRVSKQTVELLLESYRETMGLNYTIMRYGSLYGPRAQEWNGLKRYVGQAAREGRITYPGSGEERREYIHVRDAAKLSVDALDREYANLCLNITGAQVLTSRELMSMINEIMGGGLDIEFRPQDRQAMHYETTPYRFTPRHARKIVPRVFFDLGQGVLEMVEEAHHQARADNHD
ncbi:MAG: NAD(P)-dependent oxidoreductase [Desulfovibrionaceae bacterium]|nr:NAD(P)-dependent oxidoreductase [Desulfovibrionaceae bacterium]